jgi:23S rRNA (pseudouridine1915-N3)-methyltransferase
MKIRFLVHGKTTATYLQEGITIYAGRIGHYVDYSMEVLSEPPHASSLKANQLVEAEGNLLLKKVNPGDFLVLLDESGKQVSSVAFAGLIQTWMNSNFNPVFVVGGAYGFSEAVKNKANFKLSLSKMTFSHQLIRLIFLEQLYRAFTILKNEPYHHR